MIGIIIQKEPFWQIFHYSYWPIVLCYPSEPFIFKMAANENAFFSVMASWWPVGNEIIPDLYANH